MGRFSKYQFDEEEMLRNNPDRKFVDAYRRMKRIKGFYIHLIIYVFINACIIATNRYEAATNGEIFWRWQTFSMPLYWGIGLIGHGLSVFARDLFFGKNWEERKIRELMKGDPENKWE